MLNYVGYAGVAIDALAQKGADDTSCTANAIALVADLAEELSNAAQTSNSAAVLAGRVA